MASDPCRTQKASARPTLFMLPHICMVKGEKVLKEGRTKVFIYCYYISSAL
ncbi:hypothetical protein DEO72_LG9g1883 [Vigna unguiculata]|uniref:Uncharacterized protein n=1 Tax=Vigna unguiculata TaxID=3917 RepID=A0A4D6N2Z3_VIGUN|nr:hypothetical protein DEO72_LG9g1883 [Vigna unguiculata]